MFVIGRGFRFFFFFFFRFRCSIWISIDCSPCLSLAGSGHLHPSSVFAFSSLCLPVWFTRLRNSKVKRMLFSQVQVRRVRVRSQVLPIGLYASYVSTREGTTRSSVLSYVYFTRLKSAGSVWFSKSRSLHDSSSLLLSHERKSVRKRRETDHADGLIIISSGQLASH